MAFSPVFVPLYPNIPAYLGVPNVPRNPILAIEGLIVGQITLLNADSADVTTTSAMRGYSVLYESDLSPALVPTSFLSVEFKHDWRISDYPVEQGAFSSYNKVQTPFDVRLVVSIGADLATRSQFLTDLGALADNVTLLAVFTPTYIYDNVSISHYDYTQKTTNGVSLLTVAIYFTEIRVTVTTEFSNTAEPSGASPAQAGNVQAEDSGVPLNPKWVSLK